MSCIQGISANIINDCSSTPVTGVEEVIYAYNRADITLTYSPTVPTLITDIAVAVGKQGYKIKGFKKSSNVKSTLVPSDILPEQWTQDVDITIWGNDSATLKQVSEINDLVLITENKNKGLAGDGAFNVLGAQGGLYKSAGASDANTDGGVLKLTLTATEQKVPKYVYFDTSYSVSKAALEASLIVQGT